MRRLTAFVCYAYVAALLGMVLALRYVGEQFWMTGIAMYLPRVVFGLPCLVLIPLVLRLGLLRLLWTQLAAALLVVFPLMGLVLPRPRASAGETPLRGGDLVRMGQIIVRGRTPGRWRQVACGRVRGNGGRPRSGHENQCHVIRIFTRPDRDGGFAARKLVAHCRMH
jgi:hypothetical protein